MSSARRVLLTQGYVDLNRREVVLAGNRQTLSPTEIALLDYLDGREGSPATRAELLREVWGYSERVVSRTLDTTVARLRAKIEVNPAQPRHLLTVPGAGYRFAPLEAPSAAAPGVGPLVGREDTLQAIDAALALGAPMITVVGAGGMGKSRVLRAWAERHGAPLVELGPLSRVEDARASVASALGVKADIGWRELGEIVLERGLVALALDQADHLLPELPPRLLGFLQATPRGADPASARRPTLVLSSRVGLHLPGERLVELGPLSAQEAHRLYDLHRAGPEEPGVEVLLERLGHIPLAVELAAARSRTLSVAEQIRALGLDLLEGAEPQGRSLRRSIGGSWELLDQRAQRGMRALCTLRDAFTLDAARAVLGGDPSTALMTLSALRESALVVRTDDGRMRVLEPVRWYVLEQVPLDPEAELRHARWFARWGELVRRRALDSDDGELRRTLAVEASELLAAVPEALAQNEVETAVDAWLALFEIARLDGLHGAEVVRLGELIIESPGLSEPSAVATSLRLADTLRRRGRARFAVALAQGANARAEGLADPEIQAYAAHSLSVMLLDTGEIDEAELHAQRALNLAVRARIPDLEAAAHHNLSNVFDARGKLDLKRQHLLAACDLYREMGNRRAEGIILSNLGNLWHDLGRSDAAEQAWAAALELHRAVGDRRHEAMVRANRSLLAVERGDLDLAESELRAAVAEHRATQTRRFEVVAQSLLADVLRRKGRPVDAMLVARDAARNAEAIGWSLLRAGLSALLGELEAELGSREDGLRWIREGEAALQAAGMRAEALVATCRRGRALLRAGDRAGAEAALAEVEAANSVHGEVALAVKELRGMLRP